MMKYYDIFIDNINFPSRWYLGEIYGFDNWMLALRMQDVSLDLFHRIKLTQVGVEMDYTLTSPYNVSIVSQTIKDILQDVTDVAFMPLVIEGKVTTMPYYALVVYPQLDCVDEEKSDFKKFLPNDPVRPDRAGDYNGFFKLIIDPRRVGTHEIFRIARSVTQLVISQKIKDRFEAVGVTGVVYKLVTE